MNDNWSHYWGAYWMLNADRVGIYIYLYIKYIFLIHFSPPTWSALEPPWSPCPPSGIDILHLLVTIWPYIYPLYVEVCAGPARARRDDGGRGEAGGGRGAGRGQAEQGQPHGQHLDLDGGSVHFYCLYNMLYLNVYI